MTVNEAVAKTVSAVGENIPRELLLDWLGEIENTLIKEIAETHEGMNYDRTLIDADTDGDRILFAPDPFGVLYVHYLMMKWDDSLYDTEQYMNSAARFSASYKSFADWYNRTYMPLNPSDIKL